MAVIFLLDWKHEWVTIKDGTFYKTTFYFLTIELDIQKIRKIYLVLYGFQPVLCIEGDHPISYTKLEFNVADYSAKGIAELVIDLKQLNPNIELHSAVEEMIQTKELEVLYKY